VTFYLGLGQINRRFAVVEAEGGVEKAEGLPALDVAFVHADGLLDEILDEVVPDGVAGAVVTGLGQRSLAAVEGVVFFHVYQQLVKAPAGCTDGCPDWGR
jgi:hypothetical protein